MFGISGEAGNADELLSMMKEARNDVDEEKRKQKDMLRRTDKEKLQAGQKIVKMAVSRGALRKRHCEDIGRGSSVDNAGEDEDATSEEEKKCPALWS